MTDAVRRPKGRQRLGPDGPLRRGAATATPAREPRPGWRGPTYYGRRQLKPAPFNNWMVGGYIFLAGLSGSASLLSGLAEATAPRRFAGLARRGRYWAVLAPTLGSALLVWDLHTPKRFYNMLRVAKATSPMSIGTWILMVFSVGSMPAAAAQFLADKVAGLGWLRPVARVAHAPAAVAGMGLSVYTASLLTATSTPTWAAAPRALAVRFGASAVAAGAAALRLGEQDPATCRALEAVQAGALGVELVAGEVQKRRIEETGAEQAAKGGWGRAEKLLATGLGVLAPLALLGASAVCRARDDEDAAEALAAAAALCTLAGGLALRTTVMSVGDESAERPEISFRFSQPRNLPKVA